VVVIIGSTIAIIIIIYVAGTDDGYDVDCWLPCG